MTSGALLKLSPLRVLFMSSKMEAEKVCYRCSRAPPRQVGARLVDGAVLVVEVGESCQHPEVHLSTTQTKSLHPICFQHVDGYVGGLPRMYVLEIGPRW